MRKEEVTERNNWVVNLCPSSKCDRGCGHCSANGSMNGSFFTVDQTETFVGSLRRFSSEVHEKENLVIGFKFALTGNGEIMLNPEYPQILDVLFGSAANVQARIVTSGVDSDEEEKRLLGFLSRSYIGKIEWFVSFNLFQSGFPTRLTRTLKILFENGVEKVTIRTAQAPEDYQTIIKLNEIIKESFGSWIEKSNLLYRNFLLKTPFGEKTIFCDLMLLHKRGKAAKLRNIHWQEDSEFSCCYLSSDWEKMSPIHIGSDGYYYPSCDCPIEDSLRIGHISDEIYSVRDSFYMLHRAISIWMKKYNCPDDDICGNCRRAMSDLRSRGILGKIGIR